MTDHIDTFQLGENWLAHSGEFVAFGRSKPDVEAAVTHPNNPANEEFIVMFSESEWRILVAYAQSIDRIVPQTDFASNILFEGEEAPRVGEAVSGDRMFTPAALDPRNAKYAVLSPAGRKYGTWAIMRKSTRTETNWYIVMPDVGSAETARRLVAMLNAQGVDVGSKLVARVL